MIVDVIETPELGDRTYVVSDGEVALAIDVQRDIDRVLEVLDRRHARLELVCESHRHNDYVSGGLALARATGATYGVPRGEDVQAPHRDLSDGERIVVGRLRVQVVETPGHTEGHAAYIVDQPSSDQPPAVFTGGSLLFGGVGRTDLVAPDRTRPLAAAQFRSARRLTDLLPDDAVVYPTHGFGSFCSSGASTSVTSSTIGDERRCNSVFASDDEDLFVDTLVAGLTAYPAYYSVMGELNRRGMGAADLSEPIEVDPAELARRVHAGEWVVDLRTRRAYAAGHVVGTLGFELSGSFATYLGWLIPWDIPLTLIGATPQDIVDAQRQLVRIGIDRPAGASTRPIAELAGDQGLRSYRVATFAELLDTPDAVVLDVRRADETALGRLAQSLTIPLPELRNRVAEVPRDRTVWVHCLSGYRASIAASLLDVAGHDVVLVDDDFASVPPSALVS